MNNTPDQEQQIDPGFSHIGDLIVVEDDGTETILPPGPDVTGKI